MTNKHELTEVGQAYTTAYTAHYTAHDLPLALKLYRAILASHVNAREADYSRMQIQNIITSVVPKQELYDAQIELVLAQFEKVRPLDVGPNVAP